MFAPCQFLCYYNLRNRSVGSCACFEGNYGPYCELSDIIEPTPPPLDLPADCCDINQYDCEAIYVQHSTFFLEDITYTCIYNEFSVMSSSAIMIYTIVVRQKFISSDI